MVHSSQNNFLTIGLATSEEIKNWATRTYKKTESPTDTALFEIGEVTKADTINYRTLKPERSGLFCERIFGPVTDWVCACGISTKSAIASMSISPRINTVRSEWSGQPPLGRLATHLPHLAPGSIRSNSKGADRQSLRFAGAVGGYGEKELRPLNWITSSANSMFRIPSTEAAQENTTAKFGGLNVRGSAPVDGIPRNCQVCPTCLVELTLARIRRYRMGYIALACPVTHPWFLNSKPSIFAVLTKMPTKYVKKINYYKGYSLTQSIFFTPCLGPGGDFFDTEWEFLHSWFGSTLVPSSIGVFHNRPVEFGRETGKEKDKRIGRPISQGESGPSFSVHGVNFSLDQAGQKVSRRLSKFDQLIGSPLKKITSFSLRTPSGQSPSTRGWRQKSFGNLRARLAVGSRNRTVGGGFFSNSRKFGVSDLSRVYSLEPLIRLIPAAATRSLRDFPKSSGTTHVWFRPLRPFPEYPFWLENTGAHAFQHHFQNRNWEKEYQKLQDELRLTPRLISNENVRLLPIDFVATKSIESAMRAGVSSNSIPKLAFPAPVAGEILVHYNTQVHFLLKRRKKRVRKLKLLNILRTAGHLGFSSGSRSELESWSPPQELLVSAQNPANLPFLGVTNITRPSGQDQSERLDWIPPGRLPLPLPINFVTTKLIGSDFVVRTANLPGEIGGKSIGSSRRFDQPPTSDPRSSGEWPIPQCGKSPKGDLPYVLAARGDSRALTPFIFRNIPVLPPELRPIVQLNAGQLASSDVNDLYRRVISRNNRLKYYLTSCGPHLVEFLVRSEQHLVQLSVDALLGGSAQNGKTNALQASIRKENTSSGPSSISTRGQTYKSLSERIGGKQGRFRQNLLGKRVDYSGRSVIVVGPKLKLNECGIPYEMAVELFQAFLIRHILELQLAKTIRGAKNILRYNQPFTQQLLRNVIQSHPVLLNRAPTLHRLGIQAFQPKLVPGRAIQLHPLVCTSFNADFDGDQMAVHVPLSAKARIEARLLMLATTNWFSPATGQPSILPSQDMVLGFYYLTIENPISSANLVNRKQPAYNEINQLGRDTLSKSGSNVSVGSAGANLHYSEVGDKGNEQAITSFTDSNSVNCAYQKGDIDLHAQIWLSPPPAALSASTADNSQISEIGRSGVNPCRYEETGLAYSQSLAVQTISFSGGFNTTPPRNRNKISRSGKPPEEPLFIRISSSARSTKVFSSYKWDEDSQERRSNPKIRTTAGRLLVNQKILETARFGQSLPVSDLFCNYKIDRKPPEIGHVTV